MGFFTRLTTLAKADAHGVVDALEDKALVLRQHVREAGAELERKRCRIAALDAEETELAAAAEAVRTKKGALDADVRLALEEDKEDLARFAIKKLLPLEERERSIERRREALGKERAELAEELTRQEAEYDELKTRVHGYLARRGHEGSAWPGDLACEAVVADEDVELELLRRKKAAGGEGGR